MVDPWDGYRRKETRLPCMGLGRESLDGICLRLGHRMVIRLINLEKSWASEICWGHYSVKATDSAIVFL